MLDGASKVLVNFCLRLRPFICLALADALSVNASFGSIGKRAASIGKGLFFLAEGWEGEPFRRGPALPHRLGARATLLRGEGECPQGPDVVVGAGSGAHRIDIN